MKHIFGDYKEIRWLWPLAPVLSLMLIGPVWASAMFQSFYPYSTYVTRLYFLVWWLGYAVFGTAPIILVEGIMIYLVGALRAKWALRLLTWVSVAAMLTAIYTAYTAYLYLPAGLELREYWQRHYFYQYPAPAAFCGAAFLTLLVAGRGFFQAIRHRALWRTQGPSNIHGSAQWSDAQSLQARGRLQPKSKLIQREHG